MPRTPFKNGVTDLTWLNGQEYPGLCLLSLVAMKGIFYETKKNDKAQHSKLRKLEKHFSLLLLLMLSLEARLTQEEYKESELLQLESDIRLFLRFYRTVLGPFAEALSTSGLRIPKFHALLHFPRYIRWHGATTNFFGGFLEAFQRLLVKIPCQRSSKKHATFQNEILKRNYEKRA